MYMEECWILKCNRTFLSLVFYLGAMVPCIITKVFTVSVLTGPLSWESEELISWAMKGKVKMGLIQRESLKKRNYCKEK